MHVYMHARPNEQAEERLQQLLAGASPGREKKTTAEDLPGYLFDWLHEVSGSAGPGCQHLA